MGPFQDAVGRLAGSGAAGAGLGVVNCEVTVRDIGNLFEGLSLAANFEEMLIVDKGISLLGVSDVVYQAGDTEKNFEPGFVVRGELPREYRN